MASRAEALRGDAKPPRRPPPPPSPAPLPRGTVPKYLRPPPDAKPYMRPLRPPQTEKFAQLIAAGWGLEKGWERAGLEGTGSSAYLAAATLFKRDPNLRARIAYLMAQHADAAAVTTGELTAMLRQTYRASMEAKQYGAAVSAALALGKAHGLIIEKAQLEIIRRPTRDPDAPAELAIEGWVESLAGGSEQVILGPPGPGPSGPVRVEAVPPPPDDPEGTLPPEPLSPDMMGLLPDVDRDGVLHGPLDPLAEIEDLFGP